LFFASCKQKGVYKSGIDFFWKHCFGACSCKWMKNVGEKIKEVSKSLGLHVPL